MQDSTQQDPVVEQAVQNLQELARVLGERAADLHKEDWRAAYTGVSQLLLVAIDNMQGLGNHLSTRNLRESAES